MAAKGVECSFCVCPAMITLCVVVSLVCQHNFRNVRMLRTENNIRTNSSYAALNNVKFLNTLCYLSYIETLNLML